MSRVCFLQFAYVITGLAPRILLDLFKAQIIRNIAFKSNFLAWDDSEQQHEWLKKENRQSPFYKDYICKAVQNNDACSWDVTTLSAVLGTIMEPAEEPSKLSVKYVGGKKKARFQVVVRENTRCKSWHGFRVNIRNPSNSNVYQCRVSKVEETQFEVVSTEKANDWEEQLEKEADVFLPLQEVEAVVAALRTSRNTLFHRSTPEMSKIELEEFMEYFHKAMCCPSFDDRRGLYLQEIEETTNCELFVGVLKMW